MTKDTNNNSKSWLKGVLSNRNQLESVGKEELDSMEFIDTQSNNTEEYEPSVPVSNKHLLSKDNQDKLSLDMILSLENMLNDRQLILYKNKGLESQLNLLNETISRLKYDIAKKEQLIQDKNQEISAVENNLTNKQMNYDQLLEDYKDHQYHSKNEFEKVSNKLETETSKYIKLNEEFTNTQYQNMIKAKDLDERIRDLEIENNKYLIQYERVLDEKKDLMNTINDFTERMSFSFSPKAISITQSEE
jgi:hypothetical protein